MECEFLERVSMLIDGEMSGEASDRVRKHITSCAVCSEAEREFLLVRQQIRSCKPATDSHNLADALREITGGTGARWWKQRIALPLPAFALAVLLIIAFASWILFVRPFTGDSERRAQQARPSQIRTPAPVAPVEGQPDFSRYDHGERAVIYKARRTDSGTLER